MNEMSFTLRPSARRVMARVGDLLPAIDARSDEIERGARVPLDLLDQLEEAGVFRMALPATLGGEGLSGREVADVIEAIAGADASVAWHAMVACGTQVISARLPLASLQQYYANGPDTWAKSVSAPKGIGIPVEGGYRVSGRWPLASGCRRFDWIGLGFMVKDGDGIRRLPDGRPDLRTCLVPRGDARIIETWDAVGLRGTRSDDIEVKDMFVPEEWQASFFGESSIKAPILGLSMPNGTIPQHTAVVVGILKAAIRDLAGESLTRKPAFNPTTVMKDDPVFRTRFGELAARAEALYGLHDLCIAVLGRCDDEGRDVTRFEAARIGAADALVHHEGTELMNQIMMLSGSGGVYMSSRQQRRWRDLRCVAQHQAANIGLYEGYAQALIGQALEDAGR